ncbi:unnamed protein product [Rhizophagus irregularis]|uniref:Prolyl 4-hydroxylase alpha subunit domain-containing protein n=2 Tax=Rhizophagus irregularis TaxID=588596 RepID=A0A915ZVT8_9GLOM|nr:unnamed protein product [Rhizophagus irregularis]CAB4477344.1 unnamed protein product [Rhizophagus irregularis]CAB5375960.1 unnamed protein product [Rhizophagus irregularis]CAB5391746.1 unnamed protein product [Rhizophagus irregularis]CAB5395369.1 unnamed protein product [Rhizophagus irregularis]
MDIMETSNESKNILNSDFDINSLKIIPIDLSSIYYGYEPLAFIIDNVLTLEECNTLINLSENDPNIKYEEALLNIGGGKQISAKDVRNSSRYIRDDFILSSEIFNRISHVLPQTWQRRKKSFPISCLNERLRFLKYKKGEFFKNHQDGMYRRDDGSETSFVTLQLYLNEGYQGGETTFLNNSLNVRIPVVPKPGRVLIFEHQLLHEGSKLIDGIKYVIRTDIMYKTAQ